MEGAATLVGTPLLRMPVSRVATVGGSHEAIAPVECRGVFGGYLVAMCSISAARDGKAIEWNGQWAVQGGTRRWRCLVW